MKLNIKRINYSREEDDHGKWWSWDEICDRCGADCGHSDFITMTPPDKNKSDYCVQCLREMLDVN